MNKVWDYESKKDDTLSKLVEKEGDDIVMTKPEMAEYLMNRLNFEENDILMEPCKGKGSFYNAFPKHTINKYCEINEGIDFLTYNDKVDYVIANPPFAPRKLFWFFHQKSMDIANKGIYWLINISALNVFTPNRLEEMTNKGWYIQKFHIVNDKRWYGRYVFIHIAKTKNDLFTYNKKSF